MEFWNVSKRTCKEGAIEEHFDCVSFFCIIGIDVLFCITAMGCDDCMNGGHWAWYS